MGELIKKANGRLKQAVADLTGDKRLKQEGEKQEREGRIEGAIADIKHGAKRAAKDAKHALKEVLK